MKILLLLITILFSAQPALNTVLSPSEVEEVITRLFDAMRESDRNKAADTFHEKMTLSTVINQNGEVGLAETDINRFLDAIGQPKDEIWDEQISDLVIHIDGELATAWMNYTFYRGETFSHCGVNAMNLIRTTNGWKIFSITDIRRTAGC